MCERIKKCNPRSVVELTHSSDGHFEQLFITLEVSIMGFLSGCGPVIAIDSSYMSGSYGDALFSTSYDANDNMFSIAYGVMSSENYEDWNWFLQNLKNLIKDKDVVILSYRHPGLLRSVSELFREENHACCYRHLKENFSSFFNKSNIMGNKKNENALQWLDKIIYARLEIDYNAHLNELRMHNDSLQPGLSKMNLNTGPCQNSRKQRWDKMTTNLAESFNARLRDERHHSIFSFLVEHMTKLGVMLVRHKAESNQWKSSIGSKIDQKVKINMGKCEVYTVSAFSESIFGVVIGTSIFNIDIKEHSCTCRA